MPDLLTHLGTGYFGLRGFARRGDLRIILLGSLLPDLAWIARRALIGLFDIDPLVLSVWLVPWNTPWTLFFVSIAVGATSRVPRRTASLVFVAASIHLLLDAAQSRIGNGVLLLYPFSMREISWGWFWPEDYLSHVLALGSFVLLSALLVRWIDLPAPGRLAPGWQSRLPPDRGIWRRGLVVAVCALTVCVTAVVGRSAMVEANVFGLGYATDPASFEGHVVSFNRDRVVGIFPSRLKTLSGREVELTGAGELRVGDVVSVSGTVRDGVVAVERLHRHNEWIRALYSYVGIVLFIVLIRRG